MVRTVLSGVVEYSGEQETNRDGPLVPTDDSAADPLGGTLGLVHRDEGGNEANTETSEEAADNEGREVMGAGLKANTEGEYDARGDDAHAPAENVSGWSASQSTCKRR